MANVIAMNFPGALSRWRELVWPREHGSWSLALEPLALGLLAAPSAGGGCLALAMIAAFFARRPLRVAASGDDASRRGAAWSAVGGLAVVALAFFAGALVLAGFAWLRWLAPVAAAGAVFLYFDLRAAGREEVAEIAGAAAFACVPAALAVLAGWRAPAAAVLAAVMLGRAVPTVLVVRAVLRAAKTVVRRAAPAVTASIVAAATGVALVRAGLAPRTAAVGLGILALRSLALLVWPRPMWRARTLGLIEAVLGVAFVAATALAWRF